MKMSYWSNLKVVDGNKGFIILNGLGELDIVCVGGEY